MVILEQHPTVIEYRRMLKSPARRRTDSPLDARWLKQLILDSGADDAGLIEIDRPGMEAYRDEVTGLFPEAKTIVSLVGQLNPDKIRCVSRGTADTEFMQGFNSVNAVCRRVSMRLLNEGIRSLSPSSGFPMDMESWPGKIWSLSHKPIAVEAGLGAIGHSRLVLHPRYGSFVVLGTILIDAEITEYDKPLDFNPCLECKLCVAVCPVGAIAKDGNFDFLACITHNYRYRLGGFSDWVENIVASNSGSEYREKVSDLETVSMWQSLSYGVSNKSSYCMAACPAGTENVGRYIDDRKAFVRTVVKPLQQRQENIYVVADSDAETHVSKHYPNKTVKRVSNGIRLG